MSLTEDKSASTALRLLLSLAAQPLPDAQSLTLCLLRLAPGQHLFNPGEAHPYVYVVRRGLLKLHYLQASGDEWIKSFSCEGMFFGSLSALQPGGLASFGVTALEVCELERLDYRELEVLAARHPAWMAALYRAMCHFAALKEQREFELLTLTPTERYAAFRQQQPGLVERLAQKDLARFLGITPVSLSRLRGREKH